MKKYWWKILAAVLMLYVIIAGLLIPLGPGIVTVTPGSFAKGEDVELNILTSNTRLTQSSTASVWIEHEGQKVCASNVKITTDRSLTATVHLPEAFKGSYADVFVYTPREGAFALENGLSSLQDSPAAVTGNTQSCTPPDKFAKAQFLSFPYRQILYESIRNLFFHVAIWMALLVMLSLSLINSIRYLSSNRIEHDIAASEYANSGILLGMLGLATGSFWAKYTWGAWWVSDPQLNGAAIAMLIYLAYLVLRSSLDEEQKRGRISAVYNIFAYVMLIVFIGVYPKMSDSLHPGAGGNPRFSSYDMDNTLRMVFYPAVLAFMLIGLWFANIRIRVRKLHRQVLFNT